MSRGALAPLIRAWHEISVGEGCAGIMGSPQEGAHPYITQARTDIMSSVIRTQISLTEAQMDRLRREARRRHTSIAAIIRDAVDATVTEDADRLTRQRRAFGLAGAFSSGRSDTSERHDEILGEETRW
jgi:hypothetical protein